MLFGDTLNFHGTRTNTSTKLADTVDSASTNIGGLNTAQWKAGNEIMLASSDFDPRQTERRTTT